MKPMTITTIKSLIADMKISACHSARLPAPVSAYMYDNIKLLKEMGIKPFRCMAYNQAVRRINALTEMVNYYEKEVDK